MQFQLFKNREFWIVFLVVLLVFIFIGWHFRKKIIGFIKKKNYQYLEYTKYFLIGFALIKEIFLGTKHRYVISSNNNDNSNECSVVRLNKYIKVKESHDIRFVCVSDTHELHDHITIPNGDVLLHAGDILLSNSQLYKICDKQKAMELSIKKLTQFKKWLTKLPHKYKIIIGGNHDYSVELIGKDKMQQILNDENNGIYYIENEHFILKFKDNINIKLFAAPFSIPNSKWSPNKAFQYSKDEISSKWNNIDNDVDIIMTHHMPYNYLDDNKGCHGLTNTIKNTCIKCRYHVFGHWHGKYGVTKGINNEFKNEYRNNVYFINACSVGPFFNLGNPPILFDFTI